MIAAPDSQSASSNPIFVASGMHRNGETGVQTHVNEVLQYLHDQGHEAQFIGPDESMSAMPGARLLCGVLRRLMFLQGKIVHHYLRCISFYATRSALRVRVRGHSSWTVYAQDTNSARAALSLNNGGCQRVVLALHFNVSQADEMVSCGILKHGDWLYRRTQRMEREVLAKVDGVVFFSRFMEQQVLRQGVDPRSRIVIPNTASKPTPDLKAEPRDLIAIGSPEPRKNQSYLLQVLHEADLRGYRYTLTLVGSGEDRSRLEELARHLGVARQVLFTGRRPNASSLLASHKALAHAAKIENLPITLIEALAAGKPILAAHVGGIPEVFTDGVEGFFWPLDDAAAGAALLIRLMEDESLRAAMSSAAALRYQAGFEHDHIFQKLVSYLSEKESRPYLRDE